MVYVDYISKLEKKKKRKLHGKKVVDRTWLMSPNMKEPTLTEYLLHVTLSSECFAFITQLILTTI